MIAALFVVLLTMISMENLHGADPAPAAAARDALPAPIADASVLGASVFVSFEKEGAVELNHIAGRIVITYTISDSVDADSKTVEKAIYALRKYKDVVKDVEKMRVKDVDKATEKKYGAASFPTSGITWEQMLILRERPHVTQPYADPNFVQRCGTGQCKTVKL